MPKEKKEEMENKGGNGHSPTAVSFGNGC